MGARATANLTDGGPAALAGRPVRSRARTSVARGVAAVLVAAGIAWVPAPALGAQAVVAPEFEYAPGADVYLVSRTDLGQSADPSITPDGQRVAYVSTAPDLADGAGRGIPNVFLATATTGSRDPFSGAPQLVSAPDRSMPQTAADGMSADPAVSADGRYVAFVSTATNLAPRPAGDHPSVYVRDTIAGTTVRLDGGSAPNGPSARPDISADGRYVVFESAATNLAPGGGHGSADVFVADLDVDGDGVSGEARLTRLPGAAREPGGRTEPAISGDGEWIVFTAGISDGAADGASGVFRTHRRSGATELVLPGAAAGAVDAFGATVAARTDDCAGETAVVAAVIDAGGEWSVLGLGDAGSDPDVGAPVLSADGSSVAFVSSGARGDAADGTPEGPVVRLASPAWDLAVPVSEGCPRDGGDVVTVGRGEAASLSASGRTVALAGPGDMSAADRSVIAVDLRTHDGLSVSDAMRDAPVPGYVTGAAVAGIPARALLAESDELARLDLERLRGAVTGEGPLLRDLPLDRLSLGRTPISELPLEAPAHPGGWHDVLPATPFADDVAAALPLGSIVEWAVGAPDASASTAAADAAAAIRALRLGDLSPVSAAVGPLSLASLLLGDVAVEDLPLDGSADPLGQWQAAADRQGIDVEITDETVLLELDEAGLDLGAVGLESIPVDSLAARGADLVIDPPYVDGASAPLTVGAALLSAVDRSDFPWESFDPAVLPASASTEDSSAGRCAGDECGRTARFRFTFDPGPGEPVRFPDAAASIRLPAVTTPTSIEVAESGPGSTILPAPYRGTIRREGTLVRMPLDDGVGGTVRSVAIDYTASRGLGAWTTSAALTSGSRVVREVVPSSAPEPAPADSGSGPVAPDPASVPVLRSASVRYGVLGPLGAEASPQAAEPPAPSEAWYRVDAPAPGQRLTVSAHSDGGPVAVTLFEPTADVTPLGIAVRRDGAGRAVPADGASTVAGAIGSVVDGYDVVDFAESAPDGGATVGASATVVDGPGVWLVRVASVGAASEPGVYGIRADHRQEPPAPRCAPWAPPLPPAPVIPDGLGDFGIDPDGLVVPEEPELPTSDAVTAETNTVFLTDVARMRDLHGIEDAEEVLESIRSLDGTGTVGAGTVRGAVLTVDADPAVRAARAALDADPCSIPSRQALVAAVNAYVAAALGAERGHIAAIVIVGGDDVIPLAPVPADSPAAAQLGHSGALRLSGTAGACAAPVEGAGVDPCATPLSAAAAGSFVLGDDPYALPDAYPSLGSHLYVPTVAIGRVVDTPDEIRAQLDRFRVADGVLAADSLAASGYGAWAEVPEALSALLSWRTGRGESLLDPAWSREDAEAVLSPGAGEEAAGIISLNGLGDERRLVPGSSVAGAEGRTDVDGDAVDAQDLRPAPPPALDEIFDPSAPTSPLGGSLVLSLGCHGGMPLPESVYGDQAHWVDSFTAAAAFVAPTGCGLSDDATLALNERLIGLYADWIGVSSAAGPVSAGSALTFAKQAYAAGAPLRTGFDDAALMQTVFYGVPLYTFGDSAKEPPTPVAATGTADAGEPVPIRLTPSFGTITRTDATGRARTFVSADGADPLAVAGQALLPAVARAVPATDSAGDVARGALVTALTSRWSEPVTPATARPSTGLSGAGGDRRPPASASAMVALSRQVGPDGPLAVLTATPARVDPVRGSRSRIETYPEIEVEVLYGSASDTLPPVIGATEAGRTFRAVAVDPTASGSIVRALLLVLPPGAPEEHEERTWQKVELESRGEHTWAGDVPDGVAGYRWILQVVDAAGNVTVARSTDSP